MRKHHLGQMTLVMLICLLGEGLVTLLPVPFPSSVVSMILVALFLQFKVIREEQIAETADFFMANMPFFFIPACVGIMNYWDIMVAQLVAFLVIAGLTTPVVYAVTGWSVTYVVKRRKKRDLDRNLSSRD